MSFEKAGLALANGKYLESDEAFTICERLIEKMEQEPGIEHEFYKIGSRAFASKTFMEDQSQIERAKEIFQEDWKKTRYHNLIHLGGDVLRSGLGKYTKATILGALLFKKN